MHRFDVAFSFILSIDKDIIKIYNDKYIELFRKNLIDIALEYYQSVAQSKRHHLSKKPFSTLLPCKFSYGDRHW